MRMCVQTFDWFCTWNWIFFVVWWFWKKVKAVLYYYINYETAQKSLQVIKCKTSVFTDYSIEAPPSLKPTKKYSDISGLPVSYHFTKNTHFTINKITFKSSLKHTLNRLSFSSGKLHRPSDKAPLHVLWGVLLHPPPPHWCSDRIPGPSKGNMHRPLTAEQDLKSEIHLNPSWTHVCVWAVGPARNQWERCLHREDTEKCTS